MYRPFTACLSFLLPSNFVINSFTSPIPHQFEEQSNHPQIKSAGSRRHHHDRPQQHGNHRPAHLHDPTTSSRSRRSAPQRTHQSQSTEIDSCLFQHDSTPSPIQRSQYRSEYLVPTRHLRSSSASSTSLVSSPTRIPSSLLHTLALPRISSPPSIMLLGSFPPSSTLQPTSLSPSETSPSSEPPSAASLSTGSSTSPFAGSPTRSSVTSS